MKGKKKTGSVQLLLSGSGILVGLILFLISGHNLGLPTVMIMMGSAVLGFVLAAYISRATSGEPPEMRQERFLFFLLFGLSSLVVGLAAWLLPLPEQIEITLEIQAMLVVLLLFYVFLMLRTSQNGSVS